MKPNPCRMRPLQGYLAIPGDLLSLFLAASMQAVGIRHPAAQGGWATGTRTDFVPNEEAPLRDFQDLSARGKKIQRAAFAHWQLLFYYGILSSRTLFQASTEGNTSTLSYFFQQVISLMMLSIYL